MCLRASFSNRLVNTLAKIIYLADGINEVIAGHIALLVRKRIVPRKQCGPLSQSEEHFKKCARAKKIEEV